MADAQHAHGVQCRRPSTVVAIDFGTHGTGFAYSWDEGSPIKLHTTYPDQPTPYPKTLSAILYKDRAAISFGWTARKELGVLTNPGAASTAAAGPSSSSAASTRPPGAAPVYRLVTNFKLLLQPDSSIESMGLAQQLPPGVTAVQVVADFLAMFRRYVLEQLRLELGPARGHLASNNNITWVVTVPAMWTDKAKGDMREACLRAGFFRRDNPEQVVIAVEPEAAALWAKHSRITPLSQGDIYMVLDAGGGTVDWTTHQCVERGGKTLLGEAAIPKGELLGSTVLDSAFLHHMRTEVGEEAFDGWRDAHPLELLQVLKQWETFKCTWDPHGSAQGGGLAAHLSHLDFEDHDEMRVSIPPCLHAIMASQDKARLKVEYGGDDSITLDSDTMRDLFDPTIDEIIAISNRQLGKVMSSGGTARADQVLVVGGFGACPYLQDRVRTEVINPAGSGAPQVITMAEPYAAVLQGAVVYGCHPELIQARRSRLTYGVKACGPYVTGAPDKFWHDDEQCFFTGALLSVFVEQGQLVEAEETVEHYFVPLHSNQTRCLVEMYTMDATGVRFVDDNDVNTRKLADLVIDLEGGPGDRVICVRFQFGRTEVHVTAIDESTQRPCRTHFRFSAV